MLLSEKLLISRSDGIESFEVQNASVSVWKICQVSDVECYVESDGKIEVEPIEPLKLSVSFESNYLRLIYTILCRMLKRRYSNNNQRVQGNHQIVKVLHIYMLSNDETDIDPVSIRDSLRSPD